ncbi:MAG: tetratricopeptide repeat protein [Candidatus Edwardsbacteria bacterium]
MTQESFQLRPEIEALTEEYVANPKSRVFALLADAYRKGNMLEEAIEVCKKGLETHPNYATAHLVLARCYYEKRMLSLAREEFEKTLKFDPQNLVALKLLAEVYLSQGMKEEAVKRYQMVLDLNPAEPEVKEKLETLLPKEEKREEPVISKPSAAELSLMGVQEIKPVELVIEKAPEIPPAVIELTPPSGIETTSLPPVEPSVPETLESKVMLPTSESGVLPKEKPVEGGESLTSEITKAEETQPLARVIEMPAPPPTLEITETPPQFPPLEVMRPPLIVPTLETIVKPPEIEKPLEMEKPPEMQKPAIVEEIPPKEIPKPKPPIASKTLAEIYAEQGFVEKAIGIYKQLLEAEPENIEWKKRVEELSAKLPLPPVTLAPKEEIPLTAPAEESKGETVLPTREEVVTPVIVGPEKLEKGPELFKGMLAEMEKSISTAVKPQVEIPSPPVVEVKPLLEKKKEPSPIPSEIKETPLEKPVSFGDLFTEEEKKSLGMKPPSEAKEERLPQKAEEEKKPETTEEAVSSFQSWLSSLKH